MPKHIIIIYNPGYGGNFLQRLFSLGSNVVPIIPNDSWQSENLTLNEDQRLELYSFERVRNSYLNWQKFHKSWPTFFDYEKIKLKFFDNNQYTHVIFSMHFPEYQNFKNDLNQIQNIDYFYVDLDLKKYQEWIDKSQKDLNFRYRLDEKEFYEQLKSDSNFKKIDLTKILDSEETFKEEYARLSKLMNLETCLDHATSLYQIWIDTRVKYYLQS